MNTETLDLIQKSTLHPDTMPCGHPRGCIVQGDGGTAHCAWCEEVARLRDTLDRVRKSEIALNIAVPVVIHGTPCNECGGTDWQCAECLETVAETGCAVSKAEWDRRKAEWKCGEEVAGLREELERLYGDDGHPHESGDECISCERLATEYGFPYCNQCLLEAQLAFVEETAPMAQAEMERAWKETARLRELIPDAEMLHRLTYAAELWWEDQGEQSQKDIAAGYALMERLHEEATVDER